MNAKSERADLREFVEYVRAKDPETNAVFLRMGWGNKTVEEISEWIRMLLSRKIIVKATEERVLKALEAFNPEQEVR